MRNRLLIVALASAIVAPALVTGSALGSGAFLGVADSCSGSSDPTLYSNNKRLAETAGGRQLAIYDPHGSGQQLKWRDPAGVWRSETTGDISDGFMPGDRSNDRPASIVVADDGSGEEHAWVVWSGYTYSKISAVKMRRLSQLDSAGGPQVGPEVTLEPEGQGNTGVDIAIEESSAGPKAAVAWARRTGDTTYELVAAWLDSLTSDTPTLTGHKVLWSGDNNKMVASLTPNSEGMRLIARTNKLKLFAHDATAPADVWLGGTKEQKVPKVVKPTAVAMDDDSILASGEINTSKKIVKVFRFNSSGGTALLSLQTSPGYSDPSVATDGKSAWLVMVRANDGALISRKLSVASWGPDELELNEPEGDYAWPNTLRAVDGALKMLVDGPRCPSSNSRNAVLSYEKAV